MGYKIFVSYKYGDSNVYPLQQFRYGSTVLSGYEQTTARHYVDELQRLLTADDHINKGEQDGESLAAFKDCTIESRLRAKIHDSSITIVMISPRMKDPYLPEADQWMPWEIAYSLREYTRGIRTSLSNAILAVVLPDSHGSYDYYMESRTCCSSGCTTYMNDSLFQILRDNMFNAKHLIPMPCGNNLNVVAGEHSYIPAVRWEEFKYNISGHLDRVLRIRENISTYNIVKTVR